MPCSSRSRSGSSTSVALLFESQRGTLWDHAGPLDTSALDPSRFAGIGMGDRSHMLDSDDPGWTRGMHPKSDAGKRVQWIRHSHCHSANRLALDHASDARWLV